MKWSIPMSLLLATTLYFAHSMPTETTTRYTSFAGYNRFPLNVTFTSNEKNSQNLSTDLTSVSSHFSKYPLESTIKDFSTQVTSVKQPKGVINYDDAVANSLQSNDYDNTEEGRKLKLKPLKNQNLYSNFIKTTFDDITGNKTIKISTVNKVSTVANKRNNSIVTKTISKSPHKPVPDIKNNSSKVVNNKNDVNVISGKEPFKIKINTIRVTTPRSASKIKYKTSTSLPIIIKLTRPTTKKPKLTTTQRSSSKLTTKPHRISIKNGMMTNRPKGKPVVHKITTNWSDTTDLSQVKQNWYEEGVPFPNPNPEISSVSPPVSISDISSISPLVSDLADDQPNLNPEISSFSPPFSLNELSQPSISEGFLENSPSPASYPYSDGVPQPSVSDAFVENFPSPAPEVSSYSPSLPLSGVPPILPDIPDISEVPLSSPSGISNPISTFSLDMLPDRTKQASSAGGSPCPSVHISSSVLSSRQMECSDLNLVINSHFHQNQNGGGTRNPSLSTYDAAGNTPVVEDAPVEEAVVDPGVANSAGTLADPGAGAAESAASPGTQAAAPPTGGTGGTGGSGGSGDDGGGLKFPDLKNLFKAMGYLGNALGSLLRFLSNPYLYIIPAALSFALGLFTVLALFPWWIPLLLLYLSVKGNKQPKETVSYYNHVHKPIHHPDGWFWNHQTKTWQNVEDFIHKKVNHGHKRDDNVESIIHKLKSRYEDNKGNVQTWKKRKRP